jgi:hypothetical protein
VIKNYNKRMGQLHLKIRESKFSEYLRCNDYSLTEKINHHGREFPQIFIHESLIRWEEIWKIREKGEVDISFSDWHYSYSLFNYYDMNSGKFIAALGVMHKIESEWRVRIENLASHFKKVSEIYHKISENLINKEEIGSLVQELDQINIKDLIKIRRWNR